MWAFLDRWFVRRGYYKCERTLKRVYPFHETSDEYIDYLAFRSSCPGYILILLSNVYRNPGDLRSIRGIQSWVAIMKSPISDISTRQ